MTTYDERNKLASRADIVLGTGEAQTLMDMLSTGERLEIEIVKLRAEMDQRFARIDQQFVDLQRNILEGVDARIAGVDARIAGVDAKTAGLDAKFAALAERLEVKIDSAVRFNRGTVWAAVATMAASVLAAGVAIALAVAFG